jgi:predicted nucleic acid-binding protein
MARTCWRITFEFDNAVAIRSDAGASRWLLRAALERRRGLTLLVSVPPLIEYEAVMTRAEHLNASTLSVGDVEALLDAVAAVAQPVQLAYLWRPALPDVDDDMVLEAAVNGRADGIVTFNLSDFVRSAVPEKWTQVRSGCREARNIGTGLL